MSVNHLGLLILLGAIWGASFIFMRVAAPEFGIYALVELRTVIAAIVLLPFMWLTKEFAVIRRHWLIILLFGAVNTAIPFVLFNYSSLHLEAGVIAILNATAPMFGIAIASLWLQEKASTRALVGLLLGFIGVVIISYPRLGSVEATLLPVITALLAAACYGVGANMLKRFMQGIKPLSIAFASQVASAVLLLPLALLHWPAANPSSLAWLNAIALAVGGTGIAYLLYFYLISHIGPSRAMIVGYLVPLFGLLWGVVFLAEVPTQEALWGGSLILAGVSLATGIRLRKKAK